MSEAAWRGEAARTTTLGLILTRDVEGGGGGAGGGRPDLIEIGTFSDPIADGLTIQRAAERAPGGTASPGAGAGGARGGLLDARPALGLREPVRPTASSASSGRC
jgi:hypothetical protein